MKIVVIVVMISFRLNVLNAVLSRISDVVTAITRPLIVVHACMKLSKLYLVVGLQKYLIQYMRLSDYII